MIYNNTRLVNTVHIWHIYNIFPPHVCCHAAYIVVHFTPNVTLLIPALSVELSCSIPLRKIQKVVQLHSE